MENTVNTLLAIMSVAGTIIGVLTGSIVTGWFNRANNRDRIKHAENMEASQRQHAERMATFEKRLEVHQDLYAESHKMISRMPTYSDSTDQDKDSFSSRLIAFADTIASKRIYLSETVHEELLQLGRTMRDVVEGKKSEEEAIAQFKNASNTILVAVDLPVNQQEGQ